MDMNEQNNRTALMNDTTKCLLKKIQTHIDKITFLHANPTQYSEIKKEISKDIHKTMIDR